MINKNYQLGLLLGIVLLTGCAHNGHNEGEVQSYFSPAVEAGWIREGQPIEFDNSKWFPVNDYEVLMDSEVYQVGEFKGVQIFVDKVDTKPYGRLYTKFAKNRFRYFEREDHD